MVFNIPSSQKEVRDRSATDVQSDLPESNPFFKNSFLGAIITAFSGRVYEFYFQLNILIRELFVDTATNSFLERWGVYKNITRNVGTKATGLITATGTNGSIIPVSTQLQNAEGLEYTTTASATISTISANVATAARSSATVTITTTGSHNFATGQTVTIAGANESGYNGDQEITVISDTVFTYTITTTPTTPATGTITASASMASVTIESDEIGVDNNLISGTQLSYGSPVSGIDGTAIVQFSEVSGGTNEETDSALRERIIDVYQNPISQFNKSQIISTAKSVAGVTRVFVFESEDLYGDAISVSSITRSGSIVTVTTATAHGLENCMDVFISGADQTDYNIRARVLVISSTVFCYIVDATPTTPATGTITMQASVALGQVLVFFTRDNDSSIIPSAGDVTTTKNALLQIKPANTGNDDLIVSAPTALTVDFVFTALTPDSSTMRTAIQANLQQLFQEGTSVGVDLQSYSYESAIFQTVDPETGLAVSNFTLSSPSGDISVAANEIPTLGTISFT